MSFSPDSFYSRRQADLERDIDALLSPSVFHYSSPTNSDFSDGDSLFSLPNGYGRLVRRSSSVYSSDSSVFDSDDNSKGLSSGPAAEKRGWGHRRQSSDALPSPPKLFVDTTFASPSLGSYSRAPKSHTPMHTAYHNMTEWSPQDTPQFSGNGAQYAPPPNAYSYGDEFERPARGNMGRRPTKHERKRSGSRTKTLLKGPGSGRKLQRRGAVMRNPTGRDARSPSISFASPVTEAEPNFLLRPTVLTRKFSWEE